MQLNVFTVKGDKRDERNEGDSEIHAKESDDEGKKFEAAAYTIVGSNDMRSDASTLGRNKMDSGNYSILSVDIETLMTAMKSVSELKN